MIAAKIGQMRDGNIAKTAPPTRIPAGIKKVVKISSLSLSENVTPCINNKIVMKNVWNVIVTIANKDIAREYFSTSVLDRSGVRTM